MEQYDLLVIGGGPGGYSLAISAAKQGLKTALFEKEKLGGTCLNVGCIPTKYLVDKAKALEKIRKLAEQEIIRDAGSFSYRKILRGKDAVTEKLVGGVAFLLRKNGVKVIQGEAQLQKDRVVLCNQQQYQGRFVAIATGSSPSMLPLPGAEYCIDSTGALSLPELPDSMVVIGGGVIGLELACAFHSYGTEVTVIEMLPNLMPRELPEATAMVVSALKQKGITIKTGARMLRVEKHGEILRAVYSVDGKEVWTDCEQVLMAAGRKSNLSGIDAAALGLELDEKRCIRVDAHQRTNLPGIYAIGDVAGGYQLAHAAYAEGEKALADMLGRGHVSNGLVPACTYCDPSFASVGMTLAAAEQAGYTPVLGTFDYSANGMALAEDAAGRVFVVADKNSTKTLGITIVGENASEMIAFASAAVAEGWTLEQWEGFIVAHPSLCEMIREAALDAFGRSVHKA